MAGRVAGKVALVTGGAMGLGKADCELLAAEGARVIVTDREVEQAHMVADAIGGDAMALDVTNEEQWQEVMNAVLPGSRPSTDSAGAPATATSFISISRMPRDASPSRVNPARSSAYPAGTSLTMIEAPCARCSNPGKRREGVNPAGGSSSTREPFPDRVARPALF